MKHKLLAVFMALFVLTACSEPVELDSEEDVPAGDQEQEINKNATENELEVTPATNLGSYFDEAEITFHSQLIPLGRDTFDESYWEEVKAAYVALHGDYNYYHEGLLEWYESGVINVEPYKGWKLLMLNVSCDGPCIESNYYRFAFNEDTNELVYITENDNENSEWMHYLAEPFLNNHDDEIHLKGLDLPQTINIPESDQVLTLQNRFARLIYPGEEAYGEGYQLAFQDPELGNIYSTGAGCLYYWHPDGTIAMYSYADLPYGEVTLSDGETINLDEYSLTHSGCGVSTICYSVYDIDVSELKPIGETANGISLFTVKDPTEIDEQDIDYENISANDLLNSNYDTYKGMWRSMRQVNGPADGVTDETPAMTFDEYVQANALIFWQDPLGRTSAFLDNHYRYPAECGKPVIYLYPEETQLMSVAVDIDELTVSIPEHGKDGWRVLAHPDGRLENLADGQEYPYLFWEGHSDVTVPISRGFTVDRDGLEEFLVDSLTKLGLNANERADFMEFWLPRMLENSEPYFFISFLGTQEFNRVAPLNIQPSPDTLARVFMYYEPTFSKAGYPEQKLTGFERRGSTVVEWGGTSSQSWQQ